MFDALLKSAGPAYRSGPPVPGTPDPLLVLLERRDGFSAFGGALVVLSSADLRPWNARNAWRDAYGTKLDGLYFFAWDALAGQYGFGREGVVHFEPDAGELTHVSDSIEGWAAAVCANPVAMAGPHLIALWEQQHGPLPAGWRLAPTLPLGLGGALGPENLWAAPAAEVLRERAGRSGRSTLPAGWRMFVSRGRHSSPSGDDP